MKFLSAIPAKAGILAKKVPAFAGMTLLLCAFSASAHADDKESPRLISVSGKAEKTFEPDKVDIVLSIEGRDKELTIAKRKHDELLNALHNVAERFDVDKKNLRTLSNSIQPRYEYRNKENQRVLTGYTASHRVEITFTQLNKIGEFVNAITRAGIDKLQSMRFGLLQSDAAQREVMLLAVKDAKDKAKAIANTLDVDMGDVYSVSVNSGGGYHTKPMMMARNEMAMDMAAAPSAASIPTGEVTIRQHVSAQFEMNN